MLCDFGLARIADDVGSGLKTLGFDCTLRYTSPDAESEASLSFPRDVWAWGGLLLYVRDVTPLGL